MVDFLEWTVKLQNDTFFTWFCKETASIFTLRESISPISHFTHDFSLDQETISRSGEKYLRIGRNLPIERKVLDRDVCPTVLTPDIPAVHVEEMFRREWKLSNVTHATIGITYDVMKSLPMTMIKCLNCLNLCERNISTFVKYAKMSVFLFKNYLMKNFSLL